MAQHRFNDILHSTAAVDPNDFTTNIDNAFFPLVPGTTYVSESPDGSEIGNFAVTRQTKVIDGVTCVVIQDISTVDGELSEKTSDYFAQDKAGNVWYFGEDTAEYEDGKIVSTEGTWRAGVDGALAGIVMEASPQAGDAYDQENAPGIAEDHAEVQSLTQSVDVPYGAFTGVLQTLETSPLEPTILEQKYYVKGVGFVQAIDLTTGEVEELVKVKIDGTSKGETLHGLLGKDVVHGLGGNDIIDGGKDHAVDLLFGDAGHDRIFVGTADKAFGGKGNDLFYLLDNTAFGTIDGGSQTCHNLAKSHGDVLKFSGTLDLTEHCESERITGIETLSSRNGHGGDSLKLTAQDVLDLGDGTFNPRYCGSDTFGKGGALRVNGESGDQLNLAGGHWTETHPNTAPAGYDVFVHHTPAGNAYVLVQDDITVNLA